MDFVRFVTIIWRRSQCHVTQFLIWYTQQYYHIFKGVILLNYLP